MVLVAGKSAYAAREDAFEERIRISRRLPSVNVLDKQPELVRVRSYTFREEMPLILRDENHIFPSSIADT